MPNLKQLPDHHCFQNSANAAGCDDECVRGEHEVVKPREKCAVLKREFDKRIHRLFEREIDTNTKRLARTLSDLATFVGCLHKAGTAAGNDVATHLRQSKSNALGLLINERPRLRPCRAEDRHPVTVPPGPPQSPPLA